jgi:PAS domain-containing protein
MALARTRRALREERKLLRVLLDSLDIGVVDLPIVRALQGEVVRGGDLLVKTGRGDLLMSTSANPVYNDDGRQLGAIAVFSDVTEQRARQAEMGKELRAVNLAVDMEEGRYVRAFEPLSTRKR